MQKARVGLLGLMFDLYDILPDLKPKMAAFARELVISLAPFADVDFPGVCNAREQVDQAVATFEADDKDLILVVLLTYAPSHIALPALLRTRLPVVIFNTQQLPGIAADVTAQQTLENHGMHGVQDLGNVLLRAGQELHLVTGHYQDQAALDAVGEWCQAAHAERLLRRMRIGLLGYPMEGMGDFAIDQTALLAQVGPQVHHLAMREIAERAKSAPADGIANQMAADHEHFLIESGISEAEHEANSRLEWALRTTMQEHGLQGFAAHFMAIGEEGCLETLPFLAAAKLLGEGCGFGGEGDVTSAVAVSLMTELAGAANFTEMFSMDPAHDAVLMMHMGEGNWRMARDDEPVHMLRSSLGLVDLKVDPLLLAFSLQPGDVTLLSLTTAADGNMRFVVAEGEVMDFPYVSDLRRPHYKFKPKSPDGLPGFLTRFSQAGGSHHQALAYGHWSGTLEKLAALLGIACVRV
ncbi:MAG: arabinose isomerase [Anaerolineae bacterium]|nr:arabinose isomerase [Anaerolineae bacterium]